jgi:hypothetical protein
MAKRSSEAAERVPQANSELPDGAHVNIVLQPAEMPQEVQE